MMRTHWTWRMCVVLGLGCAGAQAGAQDIYYTGKLFGYYRMEYGEPSHLKPVDDFLNWRRSASPGWLLGMGDNFGPEFGASIQLEAPSEHCPTPVKPVRSVAPPETLYKQEDRYAAAAECDNVMNFLMQAGYRAVVPGREDFIYSAGWLSRMAQEARLASGNLLIGNPDHRLDLLASNLRLTGSGGAGKGSSPSCPLLFAQFPLGQDATPCTADSTAPTPETFDWVDRLDKAVTVAQGAILTALSEEVNGTSQAQGKAPVRGSVRATAVKNQFLILKAAWGRCQLGSIDKDATTAPEKLPENLCRPQPGEQILLKEDELKDLDRYWGDFRNRLVAAFAKDASEREKSLKALGDSCSMAGDTSSGCKTGLLISPAAALAAQHQLLRDIDREMYQTGYTVAGNPGQQVLIVGVVGKETMSAISQTNLRVCLGTSGPVKCVPRIPKDAKNVTVSDPVSAVVMGVRAAGFVRGPFARVIVMAQMPAPEAEVLASRVRARTKSLLKAAVSVQAVDAVLSEAQPDYQSSDVTLQNVETDRMTPIFTPPAPDPTAQEPEMSGSVALLSIGPLPRSYENQLAFPATFPPRAVALKTTDEVRRLLPSGASAVVPCLKDTHKDCGYQTVIAVLESLQRAEPSADVVLLERRDLYLGEIPDGYGGGDADHLYCPGAPQDPAVHTCLLRVALDRVLWKGDYVERVAVTGADLLKILDVSAAQAAGEGELKVTDLAQQFLVTYGITQAALTNLTRLSTGREPLWIPPDGECRQADQSSAAKTVYCVNGRPIAADQIYWVATSDALAEDTTIYTQLGAVTAQDRGMTSDFQTKVSAKALNGFRGSNQPSDSDEKGIESIGAAFQQQRLFQVDFNKVVLSFSNTHALGPTDLVPTQLQGVADSRAAVPHSQDVDLESMLRLTSDHAYFKPLSLGTLTSFVYERAIKGNLTGSPESISYPQNNMSFGAFAQFRIQRNPDRLSRALPRELLVLTPHQYQSQINNPRLFIAYTAKDNTGQPIPGQLAVLLPQVTSFNDKLGYRHEWGIRPPSSWNLDAGSYAESGFEYSLQNSIPQSVTLANGKTSLQCIATAKVDIATCFKNAKATFPIGPTTMLDGQPVTKTLHTLGGYWDVHLARSFDMGSLKKLKPPFTLASDSQGDWFFGRPAADELPTQTRYAVAWNSSLTVPVWGNLSIGPTYSVFFYQPQLSSVHEQIRSFSMALRWYLARDERVPLWLAPGLSGPASADQTKSAGKSK